jgi:hypothetical protein
LETFRTTWRQEVVSSEGFSVRLSGRTSLAYKDANGSLVIDAEPMAGPGTTVEVYAGSIPDLPGRSRAQVMHNIARAFDHKGWTLLPS